MSVFHDNYQVHPFYVNTACEMYFTMTEFSILLVENRNE